MKNSLFATLNTVSLLLVLALNYLNTAGYFGPATVGQISDQNPTLITPAGYAFAIWGIIFLGLLAFQGFQWYCLAKGRAEESIEPAGAWFFISNLANALWLAVWVNELYLLALLLMFLLLFSLIQLVIRLRLETWDAPLRIILFVWWPLVIYFAWIVTASIVNVASVAVAYGWRGGPISEVTWAVLMIAIATGLFIWLVWQRNLREGAAVGAWALGGIAVAQWEAEPTVAFAALGGAATLLVVAGIHALKNWSTNPLMKLLGK